MKVLALLALTLGAASFVPRAQDTTVPRPWGLARSLSDSGAEIDYGQEIFIAVLEGLYADGVATADAAILMATDAEGRPLHFVPGCPICIPTLDAVRTYTARLPFSRKICVDTFGPGLSETERANLRSPELAVRAQTIESLQGRWLARRMDLRRLTEEERAAWRLEMEVRRKEGMAGLMPDLPLGALERCALCDGAVGAAR